VLFEFGVFWQKMGSFGLGKTLNSLNRTRISPHQMVFIAESRYTIRLRRIYTKGIGCELNRVQRNSYEYDGETTSKHVSPLGAIVERRSTGCLW